MRRVALSALALCACTSLKSAHDTVGLADAGNAIHDAEDAGHADASAHDAGMPDAGHDAGVVDDCNDPSGFSGIGCYSCAPETWAQLEAACSDVSCTAFDNKARLSHLQPDGSLPELPAPGTTTPGKPGDPPTLPDVKCGDIVDPQHVIYVTGSSAAKPFLQQIAQQLATQGKYIVFTSTGSCVGVDAILNGTPMTSGASPAPAVYATSWQSAASTGVQCALPSEGVQADLGVSDVFASTCPGLELVTINPDEIRDAHGPVQTMGFVVPASSPFHEISAPAAYFVFGFGAEGGVLDPTGKNPIWDEETLLFKRSASSGTQALLASAIGVPPAQWKGTVLGSSDDVAKNLLDVLANQTGATKPLGILAADYIDSRNLRAQLRILAFRDSAQACAVYPDSNETSKDKQNVRDGHYPLWGPMHLLHKTHARSDVTELVAYMAGTKPLPNGIKLLDVYAQSGLVPECAMRVSRSKDGGEITSSKPENPCACAFELRATGQTRCKTCKVQADCKDGETCSQNFCEP
jgi:hypothetical protein